MSAPREIQEARRIEWDAEVPIAGLCTACGGLEVVLIEATGVKDFSAIGESAEYPTGYGCELCS